MKKFYLTALFCLLTFWGIAQKLTLDTLKFTKSDTLASAAPSSSYDAPSSNIIPPSPTAAALAKPAETSVSYYTGTSSTTLPIHTITDRNLSVPVSVNFHQGGIRVEEEASFVGLGASLNAGGVITRTIRSGDDLNENWGYAFNIFPQNFTLSNTSDPALLAYYQKYRQYQQELDTEPDLFYFNVGGVSGKFVLRAMANNSFPLVGVPLDKSNVKIVCNRISANTYQWVITLDNGTIYTFAEQEVTANAVSGDLNSNPYNHETSGTYGAFNYGTNNTKQISAWFLSSITSAENTATIQFNYYLDKLYTSTSRILFSERLKKYDDVCNGTPNCSSTCTAAGVGSNAGEYRSSLLTAMQNKYLKSIVFQNGQMDFVSEDREDIQPMFPYNASGGTNPFDDIFIQNYGEIIVAPLAPNFPTDGKPQRLKEIQLKNKAGTLVKKWLFNYGYFNESLVNINASTKTEKMTKYNNLRLRLNSVQESDAAGVTLPATTFLYEGDSYNSTGTLIYATLPSKVSVQRDLFGFYNGAAPMAGSQGRLIQGGWYPKLSFNGNDINNPNFNGFIYVEGTDRSVNDTYKVRGTLQKIIYPTGGSKRFEYASHEAFGGLGDVDNAVYTNSFLLTNITNTYFQFTISGECAGPDNGSNICGAIDNSTVVATLQYGNNTLNITFGQLNSIGCDFPASGIKRCRYSYQGALTPASVGNYSITNYFSNRFTGSVQVFKYYPTNHKTVKLGGLRTNNIITADNAGHQYKTHYDYWKADSTGSGLQLTPLVKYTYAYLEQYFLQGTTTPTSCVGGKYGLIMSSKSHTPLGSALGGNHVGYSRVVETQFSGMAYNGRTIYEYLNDPLTNVKPYSYYADAPLFPSYGNGMMTRQAVYDKDGNLLQETLNTPYKAQSDVTIKGFLVSFGSPANGFMLVNPFYYDVRAEFWYNSQTIQRQYKGANAVETITTPSYNNPLYYHPSATQTTTSKGETLTMAYKYPYDFSTQQPYSTMITKNMLSPVIEEKTSLNSVEISRKTTDYDNYTNPAASGGSFQLPAQVRTKIGAGTEITPLVFNTYDTRGNLTKYTERKGQITTLTYYATTDLGKTDLVKTMTTGGGSTGSVLSRTMAYDYLPLIGLSSQTDINNYVSTYQYDSFNRLKSVKDPQNYLLKDLHYHYANQTALSGLGITPTNTMNYVVSRTARLEKTGTKLSNDVDSTTTQISYMDGLGRDIQSLVWKGSPDKLKDILTATTLYDGFGRANRQILPTPSDAILGAYKTTALSLANAFYADTAAYTKTVFEDSPLNRPEKQYGAGQAWRVADKYVRFQYLTAGGGILKFDVQANGSVSCGVSYPLSSLWNTCTDSERIINGRGVQTYELKDKQGRVTHKFQETEAGFAVTAYCYNNLGQLYAVISPEAYNKMGTGVGLISSFTENDAIFKELCFGYRYDNIGRLSAKKVPGASWQYLVYDKQDRNVFFADSSDIVKGYWQWAKYDALGRKIQGGIRNGMGAVTRAMLQTAFDDMTTETYEEIVSTGGLYNYTNRSFPTAYQIVDADIKEVIYYDSYANWQTDANYSFQSANAFHAQGLTKGLMTGMLIRNVETNVWYKNVNYVNYQGRIIQQQSQNNVGGIDRMDYQYRFNGEVLKLRMVHRKTGAKDLTELYEYSYNHMGVKTSFTHNNLVVAKYDLDGINRLQNKRFRPTGTTQGSKQTGNWTDANSWLSGVFPLANDNVTINTGHTLTIPAGQSGSAGTLNDRGTLKNFGTLNMGKYTTADLYVESLKYHIRGSLLGINLDANNNLTNSLFSFRLTYEDDQTYFDGNIRNQYWKSNIDGVQRAYEYSYDKASRLISGAYGRSPQASENYALNSVSYDLNGNITTLSRNGWRSNNSFGLVDNLGYAYQTNSNKIQSVNDNSGETASFSDATGATDYTYNLDGSLASDANKGITIEYNYLKLPRRIVKGSTVILNEYDAMGKKLKETIGSNVTDYSGNKIYKNGALYQIAHGEGRIISGEYEYHIKDHLGNLRVAFRDSLGVAKITQANSFGCWGEDLPTLSYQKSSWNKDFFKFTGKEELQGTGYIDFGARLYDNLVPRFISIDPLSELSKRFSPFVYGNNNPLRFIDPDGMQAQSVQDFNGRWHTVGDDDKTTVYQSSTSSENPSTHTDEDGNVLAVYNDGNNGVYQHKNSDLKKIDFDPNRMSLSTTNAERKGTTKFWDEFLNPNSGEAQGRISFGESWSSIIAKLHDLAMDMDLKEIGESSKLNQLFDLKNNKENAPFGVMTGKLLDGQYATARSAGNYLAGFNGRTGTYFGVHISLETYMKLAGALQVGQYNKTNAAKIVTFGTAFGPAPWYGEIPYTGRMVKQGWINGK
jgi:RHS repeat-associated protein